MYHDNYDNNDNIVTHLINLFVTGDTTTGTTIELSEVVHVVVETDEVDELTS